MARVSAAKADDQLVAFTWKNRSRELGTIIVPSGYAEDTSTSGESLRTTLKYKDGSSFVLRVGGVSKQPLFSETDHQISEERKLSQLVIREGKVRNTKLFWREQSSHGVWPPTDTGFTNVPRDRFWLFMEALRSFRTGKQIGTAETGSSTTPSDPPIVTNAVRPVDPPIAAAKPNRNSVPVEAQIENNLLTFEGTVIQVGERPSISCGVMAVYQLAKYRVDRVLQGEYFGSEIVVDHLACTRNGLEGISVGDRVVLVTKRRNVLQRWNAKGIRAETDKVITFFVATSVIQRAIGAATSERRRFQHSSVRFNKTDAARIPLSEENGCDFSSYRPVRIEQYSPKAIVKRVQPDYPPEAAKRGVQGRVSVKALINEKGLVERACAIEGEKVLQRAAETAVLQWRFKPGYGIGFLRPKTELNPQNFAEAYVVFDFKLDKGDPEVTNAPKPAEISARARLNSENDPNKLISSGTSEPRHLQAKDWRKVNLKHFSFSLPKGMAPLRVRGTDSAIWKYASSNLELTIDLGIYSEKPLDLSEDPQSREERTRIDGKRATIVFARNDAADSLTYPYLAAAYFSNIGLQEVKLSFFATCATLEQQEIARKIFLSIDFRRLDAFDNKIEVTNVVEADKTVELRAHGAGRERPVWLSSDDLLRRVIERQPIERPGMLGRNSLKGIVTIQILIDKTGRVVYVRGVQGHPFGISSSINSLRRWRFRPYIRNGRRKLIAGEVSLAFDFGDGQR